MRLTNSSERWPMPNPLNFALEAASVFVLLAIGVLAWDVMDGRQRERLPTCVQRQPVEAGTLRDNPLARGAGRE